MSGLVDHTASPASVPDVAPSTDAAAAPSPSMRDSAPGPGGAPPGLRERARIRRRTRFLSQLREIQLRDLGGFLVEQLRLGRENPPVVQAKLEEAARTDRELRALDGALTEGTGVRELREAGIGGACAECGTVHGSRDRYCSWCGRRL